MCGQLGVFATYLPTNTIKEVLIPELVLLLEDEEASVRVVALETLSHMIPVVGAAALGKDVHPILNNLCLSDGFTVYALMLIFKLFCKTE